MQNFDIETGDAFNTWLTVASLFNALCCFWMAARLFVTVRRRGKKVFNRTFLIYALFIGMRGLVPVTGLLMVLFGMSPLYIAVVSLGALVSFGAAIETERVAPQIVDAPDFEDVMQARAYYVEGRRDVDRALRQVTGKQKEVEEAWQKIDDAAEKAFEMLDRSAFAKGVLTGEINGHNG